jgi:flagellar basal body-associated protein FliL
MPQLCPEPEGGLSRGALISTVIGVTALVCAAAVAIVFIVMKSRPTEESTPQPEPASDDDPEFKTNLERPSNMNPRGMVRRVPP